jgi:REP element-mobilizing transposase RayT
MPQASLTFNQYLSSDERINEVEGLYSGLKRHQFFDHSITALVKILYLCRQFLIFFKFIFNKITDLDFLDFLCPCICHGQGEIMKKIKENIKRVGRPAKVNIGIRHVSRERFYKPSALHITIKVRENKADIQSKRILKALHHAIRRARFQRLRIIHYTLEYNHVHLVVEADNNRILQKGMQALGISFSKGINKIKQLKGTVYKHRYHLRKLKSKREFKNALHYVFRNGIKHKRAFSLLDPYNSLAAEKKIPADMQAIIKRSSFLSNLCADLRDFLLEGKVYYLSTSEMWKS